MATTAQHIDSLPAHLHGASTQPPAALVASANTAPSGLPTTSFHYSRPLSFPEGIKIPYSGIGTNVPLLTLARDTNSAVAQHTVRYFSLNDYSELWKTLPLIPPQLLSDALKELPVHPQSPREAMLSFQNELNSQLTHHETRQIENNPSHTGWRAAMFNTLTVGIVARLTGQQPGQSCEALKDRLLVGLSPKDIPHDIIARANEAAELNIHGFRETLRQVIAKSGVLQTGALMPGADQSSSSKVRAEVTPSTALAGYMKGRAGELTLSQPIERALELYCVSLLISADIPASLGERVDAASPTREQWVRAFNRARIEVDQLEGAILREQNALIVAERRARDDQREVAAAAATAREREIEEGRSTPEKMADNAWRHLSKGLDIVLNFFKETADTVTTPSSDAERITRNRQFPYTFLKWAAILSIPTWLIGRAIARRRRDDSTPERLASQERNPTGQNEQEQRVGNWEPTASTTPTAEPAPTYEPPPTPPTPPPSASVSELTIANDPAHQQGPVHQEAPAAAPDCGHHHHHHS